MNKLLEDADGIVHGVQYTSGKDDCIQKVFILKIKLNNKCWPPRCPRIPGIFFHILNIYSSKYFFFYCYSNICEIL